MALLNELGYNSNKPTQMSGSSKYESLSAGFDSNNNKNNNLISPNFNSGGQAPFFHHHNNNNNPFSQFPLSNQTQLQDNSFNLLSSQQSQVQTQQQNNGSFINPTSSNMNNDNTIFGKGNFKKVQPPQSSLSQSQLQQSSQTYNVSNLNINNNNSKKKKNNGVSQSPIPTHSLSSSIIPKITNINTNKNNSPINQRLYNQNTNDFGKTSPATPFHTSPIKINNNDTLIPNIQNISVIPQSLQNNNNDTFVGDIHNVPYEPSLLNQSTNNNNNNNNNNTAGAVVTVTSNNNNNNDLIIINPCDVTVYGFHPSQMSYIHRKFSEYGAIKESSGDENALHIKYQNINGALRALNEDGTWITYNNHTCCLAIRYSEQLQPHPKQQLLNEKYNNNNKNEINDNYYNGNVEQSIQYNNNIIVKLITYLTKGW